MPKKAKTPDDVWPLGHSVGLIKDGGWVDTFQRRLEGLAPAPLACWKELLILARDAKPRAPGPWIEVQQHSEIRCGYPAGEFDDEPHPEPGTDGYDEILTRCAPDEAWMEKVRSLSGKIGEKQLAETMTAVYRAATLSGIGSLNRNTPNKEILRALIWFVAALPAPEMVDALGQLAIWSVEHKTAQAATIGLVLAATITERSAATLRVAEMAAKRSSPKTRFGRFARHVELKLGITAEESAERFVPSFGLDKTGRARRQFGDCGSAELQLQGSKAVVHYFNAAGRPIASVPAAVKRDHAAALEDLRGAAKGLQQLFAAQKSRIENGLISPRDWNYATWRERYLEHPVLALIARRLIWMVNQTPAVFVDDHPQDVGGNSVATEPGSRITMWHPLLHPPEEVMAWRRRLESLGLQQPFKQAHRELYLLTDAELSTRTYSNRFAGHILRQTQFRVLAAASGWSRPFLGGWDAGDCSAASRKLPDDWRIEFWLDGAGADHGPTGGYLHISTDQVRFYSGRGEQPSPLADVPPLIFSEAMRDVDLFVAVASVGNDPNWHDGGPDGRHRNYWNHFAFGELNATAATRRDVLERLIPKLRIASACSLRDRYLVVTGQLRTYKIHLGSGNILMEPNDQYLCIVPDRSAKILDDGSKVFLPFEGDTTLSVILSKAFLLADDSKIKDETITRQINSR